MSLFDKFKPLAERRAALCKFDANPFNVVIERILSPTEAIIDGRHTILAGTNNYLGLTFDPRCIEAAQTALREEGTGTTGSRMANGTYAAHLALEQEFSDFFDCPSAILFSTGYMANLGILSTIAGDDDIILLDADCHASIYDACRMGSAEVIRFRHNDAGDLEKRLRRLGKRATNTLIVVEGIYSMLGDCAPLKEIAAIKQRYSSWLLVDEAHSLGVLGRKGRGLAEAVGVEDQVDFVVGTFSKSLGSIGGFCVSRWPELEQVRYAMRPYIFSASSSPSLIASTCCALKILRDGGELRSRLWENVHRLYEGLQTLGMTLGPEPSPVVAVILEESSEQALALWNRLLHSGIYVNLMLPPATPGGHCLLRCSISAAHTDRQIDAILEAFAKLEISLLREG
jgi:8-amino-7-oxononanoate synthase